jgi:hypothetical protein
MKYDPQKPLTDSEVTALPENEFFDYIDSKAAYLKQFTQPLGQYHTKHYAALTKGDELTTKELMKAKEIGKVGDDIRSMKIAEATKILGDDPKFKDPGIKNLKTHRGQWFD